MTLEVADKPSAVDLKRDSGGIDSARPRVKSAKRNPTVLSNVNIAAASASSITDTD